MKITVRDNGLREHIVKVPLKNGAFYVSVERFENEEQIKRSNNARDWVVFLATCVLCGLALWIFS